MTSFFRDPEVFEALAEQVMPVMFAERTGRDTVRSWSVGCATGEEAYSLAMLLLEHVDGLADPPAIQIFASDLHELSLQQARDGVYPAVDRGRRVARAAAAASSSGTTATTACARNSAS